MNAHIEVRETTADETLALRTRVLRPGHAPDAQLFGVGDMEETRHFAAFDGEDIVGACYIVARVATFESGVSGWQLRGMAVDPIRQGQGIGAVLVRHVEDEALRQNIAVLWFNARTIAVGFYAKLGFVLRSEEFEIPTVGPHFLMSKHLKP